MAGLVPTGSAVSCACSGAPERDQGWVTCSLLINSKAPECMINLLKSDGSYSRLPWKHVTHFLICFFEGSLRDRNLV